MQRGSMRDWNNICLNPELSKTSEVGPRSAGEWIRWIQLHNNYGRKRLGHNVHMNHADSSLKLEVSDRTTLRVLYVENDQFTRTTIADGLSELGLTVLAAASVAEAMECAVDFDPHVVVTDLDLGPIGTPSGADLLARMSLERPWLGMVVLSIHRDVRIALASEIKLPAEVVYVVKSDVHSMADLERAIKESLEGVQGAREVESVINESEHVHPIVLSQTQGEVLRLMAEGLSNSAIAQRRGISIRSAESLVQRTFQALGLTDRPDINPRVTAARLWHEGAVSIKRNQTQSS